VNEEDIPPVVAVGKRKDPGTASTSTSIIVLVNFFK
jgi:hypothetical protein